MTTDLRTLVERLRERARWQQEQVDEDNAIEAADALERLERENDVRCNRIEELSNELAEARGELEHEKLDNYSLRQSLAEAREALDNHNCIVRELQGELAEARRVHTAHCQDLYCNYDAARAAGKS